MKNVSRIIIARKIIRLKNNKKVFTAIPAMIEKTTNPFLYSFFNGLKNVLAKMEKESTSKHALLRDEKKRIKPRGASLYQNFRNKNGMDR